MRYLSLILIVWVAGAASGDTTPGDRAKQIDERITRAAKKHNIGKPGRFVNPDARRIASEIMIRLRMLGTAPHFENRFAGAVESLTGTTLDADTQKAVNELFDDWEKADKARARRLCRIAHDPTFTDAEFLEQITVNPLAGHYQKYLNLVAMVGSETAAAFRERERELANTVVQEDTHAARTEFISEIVDVMRISHAAGCKAQEQAIPTIIDGTIR